MFDWVLYRPPKILEFSKWSWGGANHHDCYKILSYVNVLVKGTAASSGEKA